jgi:ABC-2 type transport system ATP-binding protein
MKEYTVQTNSLTKTYHGVNALEDVSVTMEPGKIYGLIGQNGAGKTTFMRLLAGLAFPEKGTIELFGQSGEKNLQSERKRMGCMIETPGLIPGMSAKDNLEYYRILRGIPGKGIEDELLTLVGLSDTGKKKSKNFSLGMKQRLGIAIALLGDPELLILDEPINGLDPLGVVEMRGILKRLCEERQISILISSHNLPELYQVATSYLIIHLGKILQSISLEKLEESCRHHYIIRSSKPEKLVNVLEMQLKSTNFKVMPDRSVKVYDYLEDRELLSRTLSENGIVVTDFFTQGDTLENYFLSVIGGGHHG